MGLLIIAISLAFNWQYHNVPEPSAKGSLNRDNTQKNLQGSEAQILFQQAFILLMPPEDGTRLASSQQLFQRVIGIDPNFAGGYAGKSVALSFQVLFIKSAQPADDLSQATTLAERAVDIDHEYPLGFAALALAQSLNADTDRCGAIRQRRFPGSSRKLYLLGLK
ncbi:MAG: hypothetical protein DRR42_22600 [Gammaproteobacteria bacterium]|nr:MAG: hypothetical protein DRR42_22600 [Gammaproteobacteria bacterium]